MKLRLLIAILVLLLLGACSEKDDNPTDVKVYGYKLEQFVNQETVRALVDSTAADSTDFRNLFAYEIVSGEDGFSPRESSYAGYDLSWDTFKEGFVVPGDNNRTWFADPALPGAFKVRDTGLFRLYRKIDVFTSETAKTMIELGGLTIHQIPNWDGDTEPAIKLSDLLIGIAAYDSLRIICHDSYGLDKIYYPTAIADGYYLLDTERTIFPTAAIPNNQKKMKKVSYLQVYGSALPQNHEFDLTPNSASDIVFDLPGDLSSFTRSELENYGGE